MTTHPQRILYVQRPSGGGSSLCLYELVRGLDRALYEPVILFLKDNEYRESFEALGVEMLSLGNAHPRGRYKNSSLSIVATIKKTHALIARDIPLAIQIARIIKTRNIDLVHQNLGFERAAIIAARITGKPQVCHFRHLGKVPRSVKWMSRWVDVAIYISRAVADFYNSEGIRVGQKRTIYVPIDIKTFSQAGDTDALREEFAIRSDERIVTNVGRITPWKGQDYFLRAMEDVCKDYPNTRVLIVGSPGSSHNDQAYCNELRAIVNDSDLRNSVIFTGVRSDVAGIMAMSDIVVHSASNPEPFGRVIAEAMAAGTPVIATRAGGAVEIIDDGLTGLLVPPRSSAAMADAIRKLLGSSQLATNVSERAQKVAAERYSIEQHVSQVQRLYADILTD